MPLVYICVSISIVLAAVGLSGCADKAEDASSATPSQRSPAPPAANALDSSPAATSSPLHFTDITAQSGINFTTTAGRSPSTQILEVKGGGLAFIDYDSDGDLDVFAPNGATMDDVEHGPGCRMFENQGNMRFRDATAALGLTFERWGTGVAVADYDGDGHDDIFVACYGRDALLRNVAGKRFDEMTADAGLGDSGWATGCAWGDIDADGDLDLYVARYIDFDHANPPPPSQFLGVTVFAGPMGLTPLPDLLYENREADGESRTFADISELAGIRATVPSFGLGAAIIDFTGDGLQDIFVGNDSMKNFLFVNGGADAQPRFQDAGVVSGIASNADGYDQATMGIAIADVDNNLSPDVFTTNFSNDTNTLHVNRSGKFFDDRTQQYGLGVISRPFVGWASMFYDFDLDGDEDLFIVNGHTYPHATTATMSSEYRQTPLLFERVDSRFERATAASAGEWLDEAHVDRAAAFGDLDNDGDIDVAIAELNGPVRLLRNDAISAESGDQESSRHWLIVELRDDRPAAMNRRALGSRIELVHNGRTQTRWIFSGGSFQSSSAPYAHFGLGDVKPAAGNTILLKITWPDGHVQQFEDIQPDQRLTIIR